MGFCSRCGEPCTLAVCSCGGVAKTPAGHKVLYTGRSVTPDTDRWERRYVQRRPATTPKQTLSRTLPEAGANGDSTAWQTKRTKHLSLPTYAMYGQQHDDVETLTPNDAGPSNKTIQTRDRIPSSKEVQEVEETISRAFGSVLDPAHQRQKWKCHDCNVTFVRDQKVYPDPRAKTDSNLESDLYCPACFAGKFSLGVCIACREAVLPDAATPFIQTKEKLWHASCYACLYCDADLSSNPQVDLYGNPCCGDCFDNAAFLEHPTVERVPALLSANKTPQHDLVKQKREEQRRNTLMPSAATLGPAVSELKNRLTTAGLEKVSSPSTVVLQKHAPPAQASSQLAASRYTATANRNAQTSTIGTKVTSPIAAGSAAFNVKQSEPAPGSPRPPITSPRIAACKAFFDGHSTGSPALASASMAGPSNVWSRPSPSPIQVPAWKTHRPSQSMPVIPKQTLPPSGPAWLKSPILAGKAATFLKTGKIAGPVVHARDIPHVPLSPVIPDMPAGPSTRVSRPLPRPPSSYTSAASTVKTAPKPDSLAESVDHSSSAKMPSEGKAPISQVTSSPKKVSAGILTRSRSFRQAEGTVTEAKDAYDHRTPKSGFQKSSSAGELTDSSTVTCNPPAQQAQKGLSHSNAIFNGKSPVREKRMPGEAAHEVVTKNGPDQVVNTADTGLSADTRCAACKLRLFGMLGTETAPGAGHKIIVLPNNDERYHAKCFTCDKCKKPFNDGVFVEVEQGQRVHEKCAVPEFSTVTHSVASSAASMPMPSKQPRDDSQILKPSRSASKLPQQYASAAQVAPMSPSKTQTKARPSFSGPAKLSKASEIFASRDKVLSSPVFGGMYHCAGCGEEGTLAETTLGPIGTRFHHKCLRCACGKQLDSGAKSYEETGPSGRLERKFACRPCIDNKNLAKRSLSSMTGISALRG